jgi:hypothetical protein
MQFQPSVVGQLMREVPRKVFNNAVIGRRKWGLTEWSHLVTLVAAQLAGTRSLRDLVGMIGQHQAALVHLRVGRVRRSTLAEANAIRPTAPFEAVAAHLSAMVAKLSPGLGREALRLIDATRIHAGRCVREWAVDGAIKLHVVFDPVAGRTTCFGVTSSRVNDITMAKAFPVEPGATYVFDLGYYAFAFWAKLDAAGCRFVTRLKINTPVCVLRNRRVPRAAEHILKDQIVRLPPRLSSTRTNPYEAPVRLVTVRISTGRVLMLVTNDLKAPATEIADLYKARWEIELFFKWIKQNLKLQRFLGSSKNAITLQIIAALIAYLLVRLAQLRAGTALSTQAAYRLIATALMQRRSLDALLHPPPLPIGKGAHQQLVMELA